MLAVTRRSRVPLMLRFPLALFCLVLVTACTSSGGPPQVAQAPAAPTTFVAVLDGRGVEESPEQLQQDFGPAQAIARGKGGTWTAVRAAPCSSVVRQFGGPSFPAHGQVHALAVSRDGRYLAYSRSGPRAHSKLGVECDPDALVLRDLTTRVERVWPATDSSGSITSMSWSPDGRRLVFESDICCTGGVTLFDLDTTSAPRPVTAVPHLRTAATDSQLTNPTFAGSRVLLLRGDTSSYAVVDTEGHKVLALQDQGIGLAADSTGKHLLITLYGDPENPGSLLSFTAGSDPVVLGRGYANASW